MGKMIQNLPRPAQSGDPMKMMISQGMEMDKTQIDTVNPDGSLRTFHEEHQKLMEFADSAISFPKGYWKLLAIGTGRSKQLNEKNQAAILGDQHMGKKLRLLEDKLKTLPEQDDSSILPWLNLKTLSITIKRGFRTTKLDLPAVS